MSASCGHNLALRDGVCVCVGMVSSNCTIYYYFTIWLRPETRPQKVPTTFLALTKNRKNGKKEKLCQWVQNDYD